MYFECDMYAAAAAFLLNGRQDRGELTWSYTLCGCALLFLIIFAFIVHTCTQSIQHLYPNFIEYFSHKNTHTHTCLHACMHSELGIMVFIYFFCILKRRSCWLLAVYLFIAYSSHSKNFIEEKEPPSSIRIYVFASKFAPKERIALNSLPTWIHEPPLGRSTFQ